MYQNNFTYDLFILIIELIERQSNLKTLKIILPNVQNEEYKEYQKEEKAEEEKKKEEEQKTILISLFDYFFLIVKDLKLN